MFHRTWIAMAAAGAAAGLVTGFFGAGGGMVLVPLLTALTDLEEEAVFPTSVSIILPVCIVSLLMNLMQNLPDLRLALPYLLGSALGGFAAGKWGRKIPVLWLHRVLGIFILWGGIRYLC